MWMVYICYPFASPGPVFCLLLRVSSDYAQPITGQVTEVTCPVIGRAQPELAPSKRQKTGPVLGPPYDYPNGCEVILKDMGKAMSLFNLRMDVLSQDILKSRSREIRVYFFLNWTGIGLKFGRHIGSGAAEMSAKCQSDTIIITPNRAASRLHAFETSTLMI